MKKTLLFLLIILALTACKTTEKEVKKEPAKTVKKVSPIFKNNVSNLKAEADGLKIKLSWEIEDLSEVGKIEVYKRVLPRGKMEKIQELNADAKATVVELEELQELRFKVKLISKDGRASYGKSVVPVMIFAARDSFFQD